MYTISKKFTIDIAHQLVLPYDSKCTNIHGHTAQITLIISNEQLNENGMIIDFNHLKDFIDSIKNSFDHKLILSQSNNIKNITTKKVVVPIKNTTSELLAEFIANLLSQYLISNNIIFDKIVVVYSETNDNEASYTIYNDEEDDEEGEEDDNEEEDDDNEDEENDDDEDSEGKDENNEKLLNAFAQIRFILSKIKIMRETLKFPLNELKNEFMLIRKLFKYIIDIIHVKSFDDVVMKSILMIVFDLYQIEGKLKDLNTTTFIDEINTIDDLLMNICKTFKN